GYTYLKNKMLKVHRVRIISDSASASPGEVVRADSVGFWIATGAGVIGLEEVQLENKKRLSGTEFIKGSRVKAGDRLG
ncbi:MAG TPA: methionyl-tRNA formyltransferase, partial [Terriglobales bacterium]|nr:methionyl-tRNA formyltransferase [Terriglobales bacterium]